MANISTEDVSLQCFDKNEVFVDENEKFLELVSSHKIECPEMLNREMLKKFQLCQTALKIYIKQLIILNEPRVRFLPANDITGLQQQIEVTDLSMDAKKFLLGVSKTAYTCLEREGCFEDLVEFDAERHAIMDVFGKDQHVIAQFDMLCLMNKDETKQPNTCTTKTEQIHLNVPSPITGSDTTNSPRILIEDDISACHGSAKNIFIRKSTSQGSSKSSRRSVSSFTNMSGNGNSAVKVTANQETTVISLLFTPRNYISACEIFQQLLYLHLCSITHIYFVVCHSGPLVEDQRLALYKYHVADDITDVCHQGKLNVERLENVWRELTGKNLHTLADVKDYFRYLVYDCPGVKNSEQEKKDRYSRQQKRKAQRQEKKKMQNMAEKQNMSPMENFHSMQGRVSKDQA